MKRLLLVPFLVISISCTTQHRYREIGEGDNKQLVVEKTSPDYVRFEMPFGLELFGIPLVTFFSPKWEEANEEALRAGIPDNNKRNIIEQLQPGPVQPDNRQGEGSSSGSSGITSGEGSSGTGEEISGDLQRRGFL